MMEKENVKAATKLSETGAEIKILQAEVVKAQQLKEKRSSETELPVVPESEDTRAHVEEKPPKKGHFGNSTFVLSSEFVLISEVH